MNDGVQLTDLERQFLARCGDTQITRRRIRWVLVMALLFAGVLLATFKAWERSPGALLAIALTYLAITTAEKVAYGRGVLVYKSLLSKLSARVRELEGTAQ